ncbi:MAG TPA: hypothetical protein VH796_11450 [Nitrososphaeraceae archaeon]
MLVRSGKMVVKRYIYYIAISIVGIVFSVYFYNLQVNKPQYGLQVDPTKDTTDIAGTQYRIRLTNIGLKPITDIKVIQGKKDVQNLSALDAGQSFYFYPKPDTVVSTVNVTTKEGIHVYANYRTPTKVLGLPGAGR